MALSSKNNAAFRPGDNDDSKIEFVYIPCIACGEARYDYAKGTSVDIAVLRAAYGEVKIGASIASRFR